MEKVGIILSRVLNYLKKGGDANISTISRKLDIEKGTIIMLLDQLVKRGYLEEVIPIEELTDNCTPIKCAGCTKASSCSPLLTTKYKLLRKK